MSRPFGITVDTPEGRAFLRREMYGGSAGEPRDLGSRYPACPECNERSIAWINGICARCHNAARGAHRPNPPRPASAPPPIPAKPETPAHTAASAELVAWHRGMALRAAFPDGTVGTIAAALGYTVEYVEGNELKGSTATWTINGRSQPDFGRIWVLNNLPFEERERVLAHEIGHCLLKPELDPALEPWEAEAVCNSFAHGLTGGTRTPR